MKFNIVRDQHENRIAQYELPLIGYFVIRREGLRPHLSVEEPLYSHLRTIFRAITIFGLLLLVIEGVVLALGITGYAVAIFVVGALTELIEIVNIGEHQVIRASTTRVTSSGNEATIKTDE